jgi:TetR/AcrR family transcriptional regulator, regulator of cefoperazone and chloramphenicol sensitivity
MFESHVTSPELNADTRERLLDAAGRVFAEHGYRDATIREICKQAGANLAAVNYHFGGKDRLYAEVLKFADHLSQQRHPQFLPELAAMTPEQQLGSFIRQFLRRVLDTGRPEWHDQLMAREMAEPTPALEELAERNIKPRAQALQKIIRALLGDAADDRTVQLCAASVVGQCLMYHRCRMVVKYLLPAIPLEGQDAADVLESHVTRFSIDAIHAMKAAGGAAGKGARP